VQQEVFGLNRQIRGICDLLAEEGYVVLAPDLFARLERDVDLGYTPPEFERALPVDSRFDGEHGLADVGAAIAALRAMPEVAGGIGTIGFCLGRRMAVKTAARHEVDCAVSYYGVGIEDCLDLVDDIRCPMVLHFAELDSFNPPATVERIRRGFAGSKNVKTNVYAGVDHAFASPERPPYDKPAAMMAYSRSLAS
jgi:carboxymethylenebutenolidase